MADEFGTLTPRQQRFIQEFMVDLCAGKAVVRAGYSPRGAYVHGCRLLRNPKIRQAIDQAIEQQSERTGIKSDAVLRHLMEIASVDIAEIFDEAGELLPLRKIPPHVRRAIAGIDTEDLFEGRGKDRRKVGRVRKVRLWDKVKALESLGKHLKLFAERIELSTSLEELIAASYRIPYGSSPSEGGRKPTEEE